VLSSASGAFLRGFISADVNPIYLKITFAVLLLIASYFIAYQPKKRLNI